MLHHFGQLAGIAAYLLFVQQARMLTPKRGIMANNPSSADDLFCFQRLPARLLQQGRRQHSQKPPKVQLLDCHSLRNIWWTLVTAGDYSFAGFKLQRDRLDGYSFLLPESWTPLSVRSQISIQRHLCDIMGLC